MHIGVLTKSRARALALAHTYTHDTPVSRFSRADKLVSGNKASSKKKKYQNIELPRKVKFGEISFGCLIQFAVNKNRI